MGTVPSLSNRDEAGLPAIGGGFLGTPSLSRSKRTRSSCLKTCHEIRTPQRSPGVRAIPQSVHVGGRFRVGDEPTPLRRRPALSPAIHFQQRVWTRQATVGCGARPSPAFRRRHDAGAHWIELHIAQGCPQMRFVERTGIESPLPYVARRTLLAFQQAA